MTTLLSYMYCYCGKTSDWYLQGTCWKNTGYLLHNIQGIYCIRYSVLIRYFSGYCLPVMVICKLLVWTWVCILLVFCCTVCLFFLTIMNDTNCKLLHQFILFNVLWLFNIKSSFFVVFSDRWVETLRTPGLGRAVSPWKRCGKILHSTRKRWVWFLWFIVYLFDFFLTFFLLLLF